MGSGLGSDEVVVKVGHLKRGSRRKSDADCVNNHFFNLTFQAH